MALTIHLTDSLANRLKTRAALQRLPPEQLALDILSSAKENRAEWSRLRPFLPCYVPDEQDAEHAADLRVTLRRQSRQLETVDALIAVVALRNDLTLLTTDGDFNDILQLKRENWLAR